MYILCSVTTEEPPSVTIGIRDDTERLVAVDHEADNLTEEERAVVSSNRSSFPRIKMGLCVHTVYKTKTQQVKGLQLKTMYRCSTHTL